MNTGRHPLVLAGMALAIAAFATPAAMAANDNAGMRIVRDPVTGQLRAPTHEEFKAMQEQEKAARDAARAAGTAPAEATAAPVRIQRPDGSVGMRVGEAFMSFAVVTRQADGSLDMDCVTGADTANKIGLGKAAVSAKKNKEHGHDHK